MELAEAELDPNLMDLRHLSCTYKPFSCYNPQQSLESHLDPISRLPETYLD
jgi:hypothetical protein